MPFKLATYKWSIHCYKAARKFVHKPGYKLSVYKQSNSLSKNYVKVQYYLPLPFPPSGPGGSGAVTALMRPAHLPAFPAGSASLAA